MNKKRKGKNFSLSPKENNIKREIFIDISQNKNLNYKAKDGDNEDNEDYKNIIEFEESSE